MCEFTGLDFEMELDNHYFELLDVIEGLFFHIFEGLNQHYGATRCPAGPLHAPFDRVLLIAQG